MLAGVSKVLEADKHLRPSVQAHVVSGLFRRLSLAPVFPGRWKISAGPHLRVALFMTSFPCLCVSRSICLLPTSAPPAEPSTSEHFQFHPSVSVDKTWPSVQACPYKKKPLYSSRHGELNLGPCLHSRERPKTLNWSRDVAEMHQSAISQSWMLAAKSTSGSGGRGGGWGHEAENHQGGIFQREPEPQRKL